MVKRFDKIAIERALRPIFENAFTEYAQKTYESSRTMPSRGKFIVKLVEHWRKQE